jgi:C-terminal processing protease CtpA/Prc
MYFKKNSAFSKKFNVNLSGITVAAYGPLLKKFEITNVRNGSVAQKAGLQVGDKILTINNTDVDELTLTNVIGLFNSHEGRRVHLLIERDSKKLKKEFILERQI